MKIEITERKFKQFIKKDHNTGEKRLTKPKTYIAKYFGIHPKTLRNWMKREGYDNFIGVFRGEPFTNQSKKLKKEEPPKVVHAEYTEANEALKAEEFKELPDGHPDKVDIDFDDLFEE